MAEYDYRPIPDDELLPDAPVTSDLMTALADNPGGMMQGKPDAPRLRADAFELVASPTSSSIVFRSFNVSSSAATAPFPIAPSFIALVGGQVRVVLSRTGIVAEGSVLLNNAIVGSRPFDGVLTLNRGDIITFSSSTGQTGSYIVATMYTDYPTAALIPY